MKKLFALALTLVMILSLAACGGDKGSDTKTDTTPTDTSTPADTSTPDTKEPEDTGLELTDPVDLSFVTGTVNGSWYSQAGLLSEAIRQGLPSGSSVTVAPGGGISNIATISNGDADIGHAHTIYANWAYSGTGPFDAEYKDIKGITTLDQMYLLFVATEDCGFDSFQEVVDKKIPMRITSQRPSSDGGGFLATAVLEEYGMGEYQTTDYYKELLGWGGNFLVAGSHGEASEFVGDGKADVWALTGSNGQSAVVELAANRDIKFIQIDDEVLDTFCEKYGLSKYTVPAGTFPFQTEDYVTVGVMSTVSANVNVPDAVVYNVLDALASSRDSLVAAIPNLSTFQPETSWQAIGYDLHPGAEQWYKDHGYMK